MQIISKIGENGSSNHLEIGIMNNGKMSVSVSLWTPAGRYNKSVWLNKEEVVQLLDAIDDWVIVLNPVKHVRIILSVSTAGNLLQ